MSGILIYTKKEAQRNAFAVQKFTENLNVELKDENYRGQADFVINRTNDYRIAEFYENEGIRVFNPSSLSRLANNKQLCYEFMQKNGVPIMDINYRAIPAVKKPVDGKGGEGVCMITEAEEFENGFVYQKPCSDLGKDLRVWAIGGKIIASVLRVSKTDFRSNFCLGGEAIPYDMSEKETALCKHILTLVKSDYVGIDFIFDNGEPVFNEIEDTVGARMLYSKTKIDILNMYCEYIKKEL
ncbi:MAG: RimK family alpha-L-glutamate ligase [Eubacterium sp.]